MGGGGPQTSTTTAGTPEWARPYVESAAQDAQNLYKSGEFDNVVGFNEDQTAAQAGVRALQGNAQDITSSAADIAAGAGTNRAFDQAQGTYSNATNQRGVFSANQHGRVANQLQPQIDNQVTRALGQQQGQFAQTGNLGGARAQAASASAAGQISADMTAAEVAAQRAGAMSGAGAGVDAANAQFGQRLQGLDAQGSAFQNAAAGTQLLSQSGQDQQDQQQAEADAKYQGIQRMFGLVNQNTVGSKSETQSTGGK